MITVKRSESERGTVLKVRGTIGKQEDGALLDFKDLLRPLEGQVAILELSGMRVFSGEAAGVLVAYGQQKCKGLVLVAPSKAVMKRLLGHNLADLFDIQETEEKAWLSLGVGQAIRNMVEKEE